MHVQVCYFCIFQVTLYICVKFGKAFCFVYPLLDIKWSYLYTANRYSVVNLLSFNKRNHIMLLQNFNGLNFFSCNFIYFHRKGWCLINVICVCLRIMVSNAHCVRFLLVFVWFLFFVLCDMLCQFLWIVHFVLPLQYSLAFIDISTLNVR